MSIRRDLIVSLAPKGSLYGQAIEAPLHGFWGRMAVSPPRSPPMAGLGLTPSGDVCMSNLDLDAMATSSDDTPDEVPALQRVCATWAFSNWETATMVVFDAHEGCVPVASTPRRIHNDEPIVPTMVRAECVGWRLGSAETPTLEKHVFSLTSRRGVVACTVEAFVDRASGVLQRVALVQPTFSPLNAAAGICAKSALKIFDDLDGHLDRLKELRVQMGCNADLGYVPLEEVLVGRSFAHLRPSISATASYESQHDPQRVWSNVQRFFTCMSAVAADLIATHTMRELDATGTTLDLKRSVQEWRAVFT